MFENGSIGYADEEVINMAKDIIERYHEHLLPAKICYLFKEQATKSGNKVILGTAKKATAEVKLMTGFDFIVTLAYDMWQTLNDVQRRALVDHELCHCTVSEKGTEFKWAIRKHDFEDFLEIVERYGDDTLSLKGFMELLRGDKK